MTSDIEDEPQIIEGGTTDSTNESEEENPSDGARLVRLYTLYFALVFKF